MEIESVCMQLSRDGFTFRALRDATNWALEGKKSSGLCCLTTIKEVNELVEDEGALCREIESLVQSLGVMNVELE